jgi:hypothetical protein
MEAKKSKWAMQDSQLPINLRENRRSDESLADSYAISSNLDPDLAELIKAWPSLSDSRKAEVMSFIRTSQ